jgi:hypothetical protein
MNNDSLSHLFIIYGLYDVIIDQSGHITDIYLPSLMWECILIHAKLSNTEFVSNSYDNSRCKDLLMLDDEQDLQVNHCILAHSA